MSAAVHSKVRGSISLRKLLKPVTPIRRHDAAIPIKGKKPVKSLHTEPQECSGQWFSPTLKRTDIDGAQSPIPADACEPPNKLPPRPRIQLRTRPSHLRSQRPLRALRRSSHPDQTERQWPADLAS